jgi:hypothetical protein
VKKNKHELIRGKLSSISKITFKLEGNYVDIIKILIRKKFDCCFEKKLDECSLRKRK